MSDMQRFQLDELIERRLDRKRDNFILDHGLEERPVIIWQCMPAASLELDFASGPFAAVLETGASDVSDSRDGWWYGFSAGQRVAPVFDGLASAGPDDAIGRHGWATQLHRDGHVLGGLWNFPEANERQGHAGPVVAAFHTQAFEDFGVLSRLALEAAGYAGPVWLGASMVSADQVRFMHDNGSLATERVRRPLLRWPAFMATGPEEISDACLDMARQFMGAFGLRLRRP